MHEIFTPLERQTIADCIAFTRGSCRADLYKAELELLRREANGEDRVTSDDFDKLCDRCDELRLALSGYDSLLDKFTKATK